MNLAESIHEFEAGPNGKCIVETRKFCYEHNVVDWHNLCMDTVILKIRAKILDSEKRYASKKKNFVLGKKRKRSVMTSVLPDRANRYWNSGKVTDK